jgi:hypothetical protein
MVDELLEKEVLNTAEIDAIIGSSLPNDQQTDSKSIS